MIAPRIVLVTLVGLAAACAPGARAYAPMPPVPPPHTRATLVGPRCTGTARCECRDRSVTGEEARPPAPYKRFEVRVGPTEHELWVVVDDMVLHKSRQRATECFYIDLVPGKHAVRLHGKRDAGVGVDVRFFELSDGGPWWYPSFEFDCSGGGVCDVASIRAEQARIRANRRGIFAPCGSVRVEQLRWRTGTMPDAVHPGEIVVSFLLHVYRFRTTTAPGAPRCARRQPSRASS